MDRAWERMSLEKHCLWHLSPVKNQLQKGFGFLMSPKRGWVCLVPGLALHSHFCKSPSSAISLPAARVQFLYSEVLTRETPKARARTLQAKSSLAETSRGVSTEQRLCFGIWVELALRIS